MSEVTRLPQKRCGSCSLCCKLLPVGSLGKKANTRCQHQSHAKGCKIYRQPGEFPWECELWNCAWLVGMADGIGRPDRTHYVVDTVTDTVTAVQNGQEQKLRVVQVWVDPDYPEAYKDPDLLKWLDKNALIALVRFGNDSAITILPPSRTTEKEWGFIKDTKLPHNRKPVDECVTR